MHSLITCIGNGWIDFLPQVRVTLDLKGISYSTGASVLDVALLEDKRSISSHVLVPPILFPLFVHHDIELIDWLYLETIHLQMHLDDVSGLLSHHIVKLACEVF